MVKEKKRCGWCTTDPEYIAYHDEEWGVPIRDSDALYKLLMLEGMQAGLSWITILRKRAAMGKAFFEFDLDRLANSGDKEISQWLNNSEIIRHRGKLQALIDNAQAVLAMDDFVDFIWQFEPSKRRCYISQSDVPASTPESSEMSRALKKAGFKFVGPTICYAFMQSAGLVNDHIKECWRFERCEDLQTSGR